MRIPPVSPVRSAVGAALIAVLLVTFVVPPVHALPAPSKTELEQSVAERADALSLLDGVLEQQEVLDVLAAHGFSRTEAHERLAQLAPEELRALSSQVEQLEAAGQAMPMWVWVLIGVLIVVAIVAIAS